jgi:hypothetical protein
MSQQFLDGFDTGASPADRVAQKTLESGRRREPVPGVVVEEQEVNAVAVHAQKTPLHALGCARPEISTA